MPFVRVITMQPASGGTVTVDYNYLSDPSTIPEGGTATAAQMTVTQVRYSNSTNGALTIQPRQGNGTIVSERSAPAGTAVTTFTFGSAVGGAGGIGLSIRWPN